MAMCNLGNGFNINNVGVRITQSFDIYSFCIFLYGLLKVGKISRVYKSSSHPISRQSMFQQIICTTIDGFS